MELSTFNWRLRYDIRASIWMVLFKIWGMGKLLEILAPCKKKGIEKSKHE